MVNFCDSLCKMRLKNGKEAYARRRKLACRAHSLFAKAYGGAIRRSADVYAAWRHSGGIQGNKSALSV